MDLTNLKIGTWLSEANGFVHQCPICKERFTGRKNRVYCSRNCKTRKATDVAAKRSAQTAESRLTLRKCIEVLEYVYPKSRGIEYIPVEQLRRAGFPSKPYFVQTKRDDHDGPVYRIEKFSIGYNKDRTAIKIFCDE